MLVTNEKRISLLEAVHAYIVVVSLLSVVGLALNVFHSVYVLLGGAVICAVIAIILKLRVVWNIQNADKVILLIVLIACLFRANPYLWIVGGQDQGVYVNMSAQYERTGSTIISDVVRSTLAESQKELYDRDNNHLEPGRMMPGVWEGWRIPGVFIKDLQKSQDVFQFYPLHPLWMAMFGTLFGAENRIYSIVFFSIASIFYLYLIVIEFTNGNKLPAYIAALFLTLNPLHAFFGKFPVSETVSLFFSASGFYYLIRYYKDARHHALNPIYLILSAGSFACVFITHISAFLYVPLVFILTLGTVISVQDLRLRRQLLGYSMLICLGFALSVFYGYRYSFPYFFDVYRATFEPYLGRHWDIMLMILGLTLGLLVGLAALTKNYLKRVLSKYSHLLTIAAPLILFGAILLGSYKAYQMGFTDRYAGDPVLDGRFHLVRLGVQSLEFSPIFSVVLYLTPFGVVFFLLAVGAARRSRDVMIIALTIFLSLSWVMRVGLESALPFQFYFSRYLSCEVIPYSMLLLVVFMHTLYLKGPAYRAGVTIAAVCMSLYFGYFSSFQLFVREAEGAHEALQRIEKRMDKGSILVFNQHNAKRYYPILTPLSLYYGLNTVGIDDVRATQWWYDLLLQYNSVFVLSEEPQSRFDLVDIVDYKQGVFEQIPSIPRRFYYATSTLYLYRVDHGPKLASLTNILKPGLFDIENFYDDKLWTNGDGFIKNIQYKVSPADRYLTLVTRGISPIRDDLQKLNLSIFVNGIKLKFVRHSGVSYCFELDGSTQEIDEVRIRSATFVPRALGINSDERQLGVDVASIKISDNC